MGLFIILAVIVAMAAVLLKQSNHKKPKKQPIEVELPRSPWPARPESSAIFLARSPLTERKQECYSRLVEHSLTRCPTSKQAAKWRLRWLKPRKRRVKSHQ